MEVVAGLFYSLRFGERQILAASCEVGVRVAKLGVETRNKHMVGLHTLCAPSIFVSEKPCDRRSLSRLLGFSIRCR